MWAVWPTYLLWRPDRIWSCQTEPELTWTSRTLLHSMALQQFMNHDLFFFFSILLPGDHPDSLIFFLRVHFLAVKCQIIQIKKTCSKALVCIAVGS